MGPVEILTAISVILLIGLLCSIVARKLKLPLVLLLVLVGIGLGKFQYKGTSLVEFPDLFLTSMGLLALIIIVFDSTSKLKLKELDEMSFAAFKLTGLMLVLCLTALTIVAHWGFGIDLGLAVVFSSIIIGTAPAVVMVLLSESKNKIVEFLKIESIINTPIIVLLPFIILDFLSSVETEMLFTRFVEQINPFFLQLVAGMGSGLFVGLIVFKLMRKAYSEKLSPLALIVSSLLAYSLAENLGGNGILSVTTLGLLFGSVAIKEKQSLQEFSSILTNAIEVLVFVLVGLMIDFPFTQEFILASLGLFGVYLFLRFIAVSMLFREKKLVPEGTNLKQRLFMTLNCPKGIATATVVFLLATYKIDGLTRILDFILAFLLYSIITSSVVSKFSKWFIKTEIIK